MRGEGSLGGHRRYPFGAVTVPRVTVMVPRVIKTAQRLGFSLDEVAELLEATLRQALAAGCDDRVACAVSDCCPLPFVELTTRPAWS